MDEYTTMRELGKTFDVSSHAIGRWLVEIGLRTAEKNPSQRALREYVTQISLDCGKPLFMWHQARTIAALESAGHERKIMHFETARQAARILGIDDVL